MDVHDDGKRTRWFGRRRVRWALAAAAAALLLVGVREAVALPTGRDAVWVPVPPKETEPWIKPWACLFAAPDGERLEEGGWFKSPDAGSESAWNARLEVHCDCETPLGRRALLLAVGRNEPTSTYAVYRNSGRSVTRGDETWVLYERAK